MTKPKFDQDFWEDLWSKTLREQAGKVARRPPNAHLVHHCLSQWFTERVSGSEEHRLSGVRQQKRTQIEARRSPANTPARPRRLR
jgi:hypothetical protein